MRKLFLLAWLLIPLVAWAYHQGPGQRRLASDRAADVLASAREAAAAENWSVAALKFGQALQLLPAERIADARRIRLERAKAQMLARQLPEAHADLTNLVDELRADPTADPGVVSEARAALANSQYYLTWLMRLEGRPRGEWEPEIEAARQAFHLLAQEADANHDEAAGQRQREDLEASIRLARLDLKDLQALPLPSQ